MESFCTNVITITADALAVSIMRVCTISMPSRAQIIPNSVAIDPTDLTKARRTRFGSVLWVDRGVLVGTSLGAAAGSIVPFFGTIIGGIGGFLAGLVIGLVVAAFAAASRRWLPTSVDATNCRERLWCIGVVWALAAVLNAWSGAGILLAVAATLGTIHAVFAGPPEPGAVYCGRPSPLASAMCRGLPVAILVLISTGWVAMGVALHI